MIDAALATPNTTRTRLLLAGRCSMCAELVPRPILLRGAPCPHCDTTPPPQAGQAETCFSILQARWRRRRWWVYGLLALATLLAGIIPLLAAPVRLLGLILLHVAVVRAPLSWLSPARRLATTISVKLYLGFLAVVGLLADVLVAPLLLAGAPVAAAVTLFSAIAFGEGSLRLVASRTRRESEGRSIGLGEWLLPASLLALVLAASAALALAGYVALQLLASLQAYLAGAL